MRHTKLKLNSGFLSELELKLELKFVLKLGVSKVGVAFPQKMKIGEVGVDSSSNFRVGVKARVSHIILYEHDSVSCYSNSKTAIQCILFLYCFATTLPKSLHPKGQSMTLFLASPPNQ